MGLDQAPLQLSLFDSVDGLAADFLGIADIRHWSAVLKLGTSPPACFDGPALVSELFSQVSANWNHCLAALYRPSRQNWRWLDLKCDFSAKNFSAETTLERAVVSAAKAQNRTDWSNQIPIASGIIAGGGNKKRAIDLVHRREANAYDFIELKVGSDNPLYAAIEILKYGFVWLLSQKHRDVLGYADRPLIQASDVQLSVLAPNRYYRDLNLEWLSDGLAEGLKRVGLRNGGVRMSFLFESFPHSFVWPGSDPTVALSAIDARLKR